MLENRSVLPLLRSDGIGVLSQAFISPPAFMCGRFSLRLEHQEIQAVHGYHLPVNEWIAQDQFIPRYNVAPRTQAPVIRRRNPGKRSNANRVGGDVEAQSTSEDKAEGSSSSEELVMQTMKWGLIPHWSKYEDKNMNTINARAENLVEGGGIWNSIKGKRRCVVLCQGYYEWLTKGKDKLPHFTKPKDGRLMLLAGMYDSVVLEGETETTWTFTIVTTSASKDFSWLHDRQPVILSTQEALDKWLDTSSQSWSQELAKLVSQSYNNKACPLECYQVPKEVGKVGTESSSFIVPISKRKDGIQAMFSKQMQSQKGAAASPQSGKRKRASPIATGSTAQVKEEKTSDSDDDIEVFDGPPSPKKIKSESERSKKPSTKPRSPTKRKTSESPSKADADIKNFFSNSNS